MTVSAKILDAMLQAGCSAEQLVAVVRAAEEAANTKAEGRREQARLRQQRRRAKQGGAESDSEADRHAMSRDVTHVTHVTRDMRDIPPSPFSDKEKSPLHPPKEINSSPIPRPLETAVAVSQAPPAKSARDELSTVLDPEHVAAVIEHRRLMRKPLSPHAAKLLARRFALMPDPNAAADAMIGNGWQGFEPEWVTNRTGGNRSPPEQRLTASQARHQAAIAAFDRKTHGDDHEHSRTAKPAHDGPDIELGRRDFHDFGKTAPGTG